MAQRTTEEEVEKENLRNAIFRAISIITREAQHEKKGTISMLGISIFFWANENLVDLLQVIPIVTNKFIVEFPLNFNHFNQIDEN
ncbi:hypothetical protein ACJX0J_012775, partial [Zea mays]